MRVTSEWRTTSLSLNRTKAIPSIPFQHLQGVAQPRTGAARQIDLRQVAGSPPSANSRRGGVRIIFIWTAVVFCASSRMTNELARVRPRMKASGATSISPLLQALGDLVARQHVVQGVVERPQIGIDLFLQVAGQEAGAALPPRGPGATARCGRPRRGSAARRPSPPPDRSCRYPPVRARTPARARRWPGYRPPGSPSAAKYGVCGCGSEFRPRSASGRQRPAPCGPRHRPPRADVQSALQASV